MTESLTIISGGQTGADRAALDFAIAHGIPHGGWCPRGRRAEDGVIPSVYCLTETAEPAYAVRTQRNVLQSDATVVFTMSDVIRGGTALTVHLAQQYSKPLLHLQSGLSVSEAAERLSQFMSAHAVCVLNVAGPRASQEPGLATFVRDVLTTALGASGRGSSPASD